MLRTKEQYIRCTLGLCVRVLFALTFVGHSAYGSQWHPIWRELYKELNDGANPKWNTFDDVKAWAASERDRLQPVVLRILRGDRPEKHWAIGMMVGRVIPTRAICDVVLNRADVEQILHETDGTRVKRSSVEASHSWM